VFRRGYGSQVKFRCIERENGDAVVVGKSEPQADPPYPIRRFVLSDEASRAALATEMERVRDLANQRRERVENTYGLTHCDDLASDAGYGQVGCVLMVPSILGGVIVGLLWSWFAIHYNSLTDAVLGSIIGIVVALVSFEPVSGIAYNVPWLRDRIEALYFGWLLIVPGLATAIAILVLALRATAG
jgi:hypothetical protein